MDLLTIASGVGHGAIALTAAAEPLFQINLFQVIIAAANFATKTKRDLNDVVAMRRAVGSR